MRILIVDDVQEIRERPFDVVLTDLGLPDIPGDMLISQIIAVAKGRPREAVITGCGEPDLTLARRAGADAVFRKPVDWGCVVDYLRRSGLAA